MRLSGVPFVQGRNSYSDSDGRKYGIAIHNTSNDATAEGEASYATRRTDGVSSHFYVDRDSIVQSLDTKARAGHAGSRNGNENAIAFELTGTNGKSRQWWLDNIAWDKLAQVLAALCREYGIEPRRASVAEMKANPRVRAFYGHDDMRRAWGGTTHTDPGDNFPWDHLFAVTKRAMSGEDDDMAGIESTVHGQALMGRVEALVRGYDTVQYGPTKGKEPVWINRAVKALAEAVASTDEQVAARLRAEFDELDQAVAAARADMDPDALVAGVLAGLTPEKIAAAIPPALTQQVADELAARLAASTPTQS